MPHVAELERLAGSLLCVGIPAQTADEELLERLRRLGAGGVVLFERNFAFADAACELVAALGRALDDGAPPSICVDQEGGRVARIGMPTPMPSAMTLGASGDSALAQRAGAALGATLRAIGANVNFAPVLDLALDARSTVIGNRALGDEPTAVAELGAAVVCGLQSVGVAATPKHFPGHGAAPGDSHVTEPTVGADARTLRARELIPFRAAFAAGARAVMTAHVNVPAFDEELPATLSRRILNDLLREELGFGGVVFTDCLEMAGVAKRSGGVVGAGVSALRAGADVLLVTHDGDAAEALRTALVEAVRAGEVPLARLEDAAQRVRAFRCAHAATGAADVPTPEQIEAVAREVAARGVAVVRGDVRLDATVPITVISFEGVDGDGVARDSAERPSLSAALRRRKLRSELLRVPLEPDAQMIEQLVDVLAAQCAQGPRACILLARRAHLHPQQRRTIDAVLDTLPDAVVVSVREPFDVPAFERARAVACTFGDERTNIDALADVLSGERAASGNIPAAVAAAPV